MVPGDSDSSPGAIPPGASPGEAALALIKAGIDERQTKNLLRLQEIITSAIRGDLPRDREPKEWELNKLKPVHINMLLDKLTGKFTLEQLAEKYSYASPHHLSMVINHPDAQTIMSTILSMSADRVMDVNERLKHLAPEALNVKVELMRTAKLESVRDKAASDVLAMAGYGKREESKSAGTVNDNRQQVFVMPAHAATGFTQALAEANRVASMDYSEFLAGSRDSEIIAEHKQLSDKLQLGAGHTELADGASPVTYPETDRPEADGLDFASKFGLVAKDAKDLERAVEEEQEALLESLHKTRLSA